MKFRVWVFGSRVSGLGIQDQCLGCAGFRVDTASLTSSWIEFHDRNVPHWFRV